MSPPFTLTMEDMFEKFKDDLCILFFSSFFSHTSHTRTNSTSFFSYFLSSPPPSHLPYPYL